MKIGIVCWRYGYGWQVMALLVFVFIGLHLSFLDSAHTQHTKGWQVLRTVVLCVSEIG